MVYVFYSILFFSGIALGSAWVLIFKERIKRRAYEFVHASYFVKNENRLITPELLQEYGFNASVDIVETWWKGDLTIQLDSVFWWTIDSDGDNGSKSRELKDEEHLKSILFILKY